MCMMCTMGHGACAFEPPPLAGPAEAPRAQAAPPPTVAASMALPYLAKWGAPVLGAGGGTVTWSLAGPGELLGDLGIGRSLDPSARLAFDHEALVARAFAEWGAAANIDFVRVEDTGGAQGSGSLADIRIFHGGTSPGYVAGYANFVFRANGTIPDTAGDINMNPAGLAEERYYRIVLHEIGHALGLGHVDQGEVSIMTPLVVTDELSVSDIARIQNIYGAPDTDLPGTDPPSVRLPDGEAVIRILDEVDGLRVDGNRLANRIEGTDADEIFVGGPGNDTLIGGGGLDTAVADVARAGATLDIGPDGTLLDAPGIDTDLLSGIERIAFDDGLLALDTAESALGFVARLYNAALGRVPDTGVLFWQDAVLDGLTERGLARAFVESPEFASLYGTAPSDEEYVRALYDNVLDRAPDAGGLAFWRAELDAGRPRVDMLIAFSESQENVAATADILAGGLFFEGYLIA